MSGLRLDSWIMTDNLVTLLETEIDSILGHLQGLESVEAALRHTLGL
jgi:mRNA interferase MazF